MVETVIDAVTGTYAVVQAMIYTELATIVGLATYLVRSLRKDGVAWKHMLD